MPTAVLMAPRVRLKRPVPRVRSAITSTETTPKIPAPTPSRIWMATSAPVLVSERVENGANRQHSKRQEQQRLSAPRPRFSPRPGRKQRNDELRSHHARRHEHHRASALPLGQHLAQERQHRSIGKVKHHRTDEEDEQRPILEQYVRLDGLGGFVAFLRTPRQLVIDLSRPDHEEA